MNAEDFDAEGFRGALVDWFGVAGRDLPWRRTEDPYAVLVSEFMCQQTTVAAVVPYFERWMARWPTVGDLAAASEDEVLSMWEGLGYYSRGRNLRAAAVGVMERFCGEVPQTFAELRSLPGVGEYTANAVLAFAFDQAAPVVDGNVARVLARVFDYGEPIDSGAGKVWLREIAGGIQGLTRSREGAKGGIAGGWEHWSLGRFGADCIGSAMQPEGRDARESASQRLGQTASAPRCSPEGETSGSERVNCGRNYNSAIMELGALVCRPRGPLCLACPVKGFCAGRVRAEELPVKRARAKVTRVTERRAWVREGDGVWLDQSPGPRWRGMWMLPGIDEEGGGGRNGEGEIVTVETYPITRYVVRMEVVAGEVREGLTRFAVDELEGLAVPAPHRRVMRRLIPQAD